MNKNAKTAFTNIIAAASAFRSATTKVLNDFSEKERQAKEDAAQYKAEDAKYKAALESLTAEARAKLTENRAGFVRDVTDSMEGLKKELHSLALERPNPIYADMLRNYGDFGVKPTRTELQALLEVNAGCLVGVSMLNSVLARVGSDFHIDGCDIATLEKDIENLSRLGELAGFYAPVENHSQLCKVYVGTPRLGANGADTGAVWDSVSLSVVRTMFESAMKSVGTMSERWTNLAPSISQLKNYTDTEDASAAEQFLSDRKDASAHIEKNSSGVEQARAIGKATAEANSKAAEVMSLYTR